MFQSLVSALCAKSQMLPASQHITIGQFAKSLLGKTSNVQQEIACPVESGFVHWST